MTTKSIIATRSMRYATRRLSADELFEASARDARLLVAIGKARYPDIGPPPPALAAKIRQAAGPDPEVSLAALRSQYRRVVGKQAFNGWDAAALRGKIAAAGG